MTSDKDYLKQAVQKAKDSVDQGGFPAGAVLVKDGEIIAEGVSLGFLLHDPTSHAETATVRQACKTFQTTDLSGSTLYASLQPCLMCYCSSNWARISKIVYGCQKLDVMVNKEYYEGKHEIVNINNDSNHQIKMVYLPDFEKEMLDLVAKWEKSV